MSVGIERLAVYVPGEAVQIAALAAARGKPVDAFEGGRGRQAFAVAAPCEDVVTLAATAGGRVLRAAGMGTSEVGLLLIASATASTPLQPVTSHVHTLLGLGRHCRSVDVVAGNVGSTAAVLFAHDWVQAGGIRNRCALVIAADVVRTRPRTPRELGQGAAAVAMVIGLAPQLLILSEDGVPIATRRPAARQPYREALTEAFQAVRQVERPVLEGSEALTDRLAHVLYQASSPATVTAAHRQVLELDWRAATGRWPATTTDAEATAQIQPWTAVVAQIGSTRAAALWLALAASVESDGRRLGGRRVGAFAFDPAVGGEFFTGLVPAAVGRVSETGLGTALAARTWLDPDAYVARDGRIVGGDPPPGFAGDFLYVTTRRRQRLYVARASSAG